jgi:argininosuccinate lyase
MKLWDKGTTVNKKIEEFTVGKDRELDVLLAPYDVLGTMAHITMLEQIGLLTKEDLKALLPELRKIYQLAMNGSFVIEDSVEDVHSQVEMLLTKALGDVGKKVHSGRSRNDQVLLDLKLFARDQMETLVHRIEQLFHVLQARSEAHKAVLMPGYTHLQVAMPSSFGLWFGAFAESLVDDLQMVLAAWNVTNQNPLGAAAGYGSSFPIDRSLTTRLLGFEDMNYNVVYAQMGRGKMERMVAYAMASVAGTLSKLAVDGCLYTSQNFNFIKLPDELTTGSSIMPHKKNPDVFELIRAKCNVIQALPQTIGAVTTNLPTGYFRDLQVIKEAFLPAFKELMDCIDLTTFAVENIRINEAALKDDKYKFAFSVEAVNQLVLEGMPFRDAYRQVGEQIESGNFNPDYSVKHTHEGSIGNLCNKQIDDKLKRVLKDFEFEKVKEALDALLQ